MVKMFTSLWWTFFMLVAATVILSTTTTTTTTTTEHSNNAAIQSHISNGDVWEMKSLPPNECDSQDPTRTESEVRFRLHTGALPWMDALATCWREGGRLATPRSPREARALGRLLAAAASNVTGTDMLDAVYVGINDVARQGRWMTCDGRQLGEVGFATWLGGSGKTPQRNCGALLADGRYVQQHCGQRLAFACEPETSAPAAAAEGAEGYAGAGRLGLLKLHATPLPWLEALAACEGEGAQLAVATTGREARLMTEALLDARGREVAPDGFFVGVNDLAEENDWHTIFGRSLGGSGYGLWAPEQPAGGRANNCGLLRPDGFLTAAPCSQSMPFACKKGGRSANSIPTVGDKDYQTIEGLGRYNLHTVGQDWMSALGECRRENATLAVPNSEAEAQALISMLRDAEDKLRNVHGRGLLHVGVHDMDGDGQWTTIFGETLQEAGYENWWRRWRLYPENNGNKCAMMDSSGPYFNYPCGNRYAFVCEKPLE